MTLSAAVKELDRKTTSHTDAVQQFNIADGVVAAPQHDSKAVGYHHLERLAPAQLQHMHLRLQHALQRAGEALLFEQVYFSLPLFLSPSCPFSPSPSLPPFQCVRMIVHVWCTCTKLTCVALFY